MQFSITTSNIKKRGVKKSHVKLNGPRKKYMSST